MYTSTVGENVEKCNEIPLNIIERGKPHMLTGKGEYTVDAKRRVSLPKGMRAALNEFVYVAPGFKPGTLSVFPPEMLEKIESKIDSSLSISDAYDLRFDIFPNAQMTPIDQQGRILLPADIMSEAGIEAESSVVVIGLGAYAAIMKADDFAKKRGEKPNDLSTAFKNAGV